MRTTALLLAAALSAATARAAEPRHEPTDPTGGLVLGPEPEEEGASWFALPVVFWLPETRLGFGATGGLHHRRRGAPRPSSAFLTAVYTLEGQGSLDLAGEFYGDGGALLAGRARLVHFPDVFYGLGSDSSTAQRETFTRRYAEAGASYEWPLRPGLRAGPRVDVRREWILEREAGGQLVAGDIPGAAGFDAFGAGGSVTWDTRDSSFWPSRGTFAQGVLLGYPGLGNTRRFLRTGIEAREFVPLGARRVLGLAAAVDYATSETPFTLLPRLGSTRYLRGYREGRFRDQLSWWAQSELRVPIAWRLVGVAFGSVGDVAPSPRALGLDTIKLAGGLGLRVRLTDEGANIRIDVAASRAGVELYVLVLEAF